MQSAFHNLPTINGTLQAAGRAYSASAVVYTENDSAATLSLDIHTAYPPSAGVRSWRRTISLARGDAVTVHDRFSLDTVREGVSLNLMTARKAVIVNEGRIDLTGYGTSGSGKPVHLSYDPSLFSPSVETIQLHDAQLRSSWGGSIERIVLTMRRTPAVGECVLVFRQ
jgi:hypothetical protein